MAELGDPAAAKTAAKTLLADFESNRLTPGAFAHADHVRVAFELLKRTGFLDAARRYENGLKAFTAKAGVPQKYNLTITLAFLALIAERLSGDPQADWERFAGSNPDLFERACLAKWYSPARLAAPAARAHFLLPDGGRSMAPV